MLVFNLVYRILGVFAATTQPGFSTRAFNELGERHNTAPGESPMALTLAQAAPMWLLDKGGKTGGRHSF